MRATQSLKPAKHLNRAALTVQESTCKNQQQKKQRHNDRGHDPVDQAKPRQSTLLILRRERS
jgi:hypothetical protein